MKNIILPTLAAILLAGCSSTNAAKIISAAAKDPATVQIKVTTIYGNVSYTRIGARTNETVTVSTDGSVTVKTNP